MPSDLEAEAVDSFAADGELTAKRELEGANCHDPDADQS